MRSSIFLAVIVSICTTTTCKAADTVCLADDAWTCEGYGAIEDVKRLDKLDADLSERGISEIDKQELKRLEDVGRCSPVLNPYTVTVMDAGRKYAYICNDLRNGASEEHFYSCTYVLISDLRDERGLQPSGAQLQRTSASHTMANVHEMGQCSPH